MSHASQLSGGGVALLLSERAVAGVLGLVQSLQISLTQRREGHGLALHHKHLLLLLLLLLLSLRWLLPWRRGRLPPLSRRTRRARRARC